ncbi:AAA family ATPase [Candidatus Sumerlaeota bacterium]|nr:AAA family ATPase [Candidatus Sumerlaeota bacterium]
MYNKFFGLEEAPFNLTPDSRFLYLSRQHREAIGALLYGIQERKGFIMLTGDVGAGKTTVCRALLRDLGESEIEFAVIFNSYLTDIELLRAINDDFGIDSTAETKKGLIDALNIYLLERFNQGRTCVLIIDEAQNMAPETLEQVRMISNLETESEKLIQIVLMGQPELNDIMALPELEQLNQRITVRYHLKPLPEDEVPAYIRHRLNRAQAKIEINWTPGALRRIFEHSAGVPRKINVVCDNALMAAYVASSYIVDERMVRQAVSEITGKRADDSRASKGSRRRAQSGAPKSKRRRFWLPLTLALLLIAAGGGAYYGLQEMSRRDMGVNELLAKIGGAADDSGIESDAAARPPVVIALPPELETGATTATAQAQNAASSYVRIAIDLPEPEPPKPEPRKNPVTQDTAWKYDENGILRVMEPYQTQAAAVLSLLSVWRVRPANMGDLHERDAEQMAELDLLAANYGLGVAWFDAEEGLEKALVYDVPLLLKITPEGQDQLSPWVVLRRMEGEAITIHDPIWGCSIVQRSWLSRRVATVRVVYFDQLRLNQVLRGEEGERVKKLQQALKERKFYDYALDGNYGRFTEEALIRFQRYHQLKATGEIDARTALYLSLLFHADHPRLTEGEELPL